MSNKLRKGFCAKQSAVVILATSLSLSALLGAQAQNMGDTAPASGTEAPGDREKSNDTMGTDTPATTPADDTNTDATTTKATTSPTTTPATAATTAATTASPPAASSTPTSEIPAGVLWTDPKYAVKEMPPARVPVPTGKRPTTGTKTNKVPEFKGPDTTFNGYDDKEAQTFANSLGMPQYVWTRQDKETKGQKTEAIKVSKEISAYHRSIVEKFVSHMTVPNSATLVENSSAKYLYLISFTIDAKGKISHINSEKSFGPFTAVNLADDSENAAITSSITRALAQCSPVMVPPAGVPPWYMLLKYEPNTGKVFVANMNTI